MKALLKFSNIDKVLIIGASGCGKSYLGRIVQKSFNRIVCFDIMNEYHVKDDFVINNFQEYSQMIRRIENENLKSFFYVVKFSIDDDHEMMEMFLNQALRLNFHVGNMTTVIEEVQEYCDPYNIPKYVRKSMLMGRHHELSFVMTSQRPALLNKTIISQCTHIFCGRLVDKNDLKYVSAFLGRDSKELSSLSKGEFLWYDTTNSHSIRKISTY
jgi:ABC-type dipeptide/oligopeptide/nickel transport system ATPase component